MQILAQLYACLAIIVFITVIAGIEARSTIATDNDEKHLVRRSVPDTDDIKNAHEDGPKGPHEKPQGLERQRRNSSPRKEGPGQETPVNEDVQKSPPRQRRQAPPTDQKVPEKPQAEESNKRIRRQVPPMPDGSSMPNPEDFGKIPPPPGRK